MPGQETVAADERLDHEGKETMADEQAETDQIVSVFYRTGRAGARRLADGGGLFGADIVVALLVDELIRRYRCDAVAETGCFAGDTTLYLRLSCDFPRDSVKLFPLSLVCES